MLSVTYKPFMLSVGMLNVVAPLFLFAEMLDLASIVG
jgi:hypothetical protein